MQNVEYRDGSLEKCIERMGSDDRPVHCVTVGTKPDLIKMAPIMQALQKRGEKAFLIHTGQHYDENLSKGIEKEFGLIVDVNLGVSGGALFENISEVVSRTGKIYDALIKQYPKLKVLPYVHGDTTTCFATATAAFSCGIPVAHIEAGIRTLMMEKSVLEKEFKTFSDGDFDFKRWFQVSSEGKNYSYGSHEPFPEQWNTRATEAGTGIFFAPVPMVAESLKREGYPDSRIFMVGNTVADAADFVGDIESDIFEQYPALRDGFIRVCVHRRENTESRERFLELFKMVEILAEKSPKPVLWILLPGTKKAIDVHGLADRLRALRDHKNMIVSDVWPKYSDVIAAMKHCDLCATDSGSMQEEMNILNIPTATLRYGSDRPETFFAQSNVLCPPMSAEFMAEICLRSLESKECFIFPEIYGKSVSDAIVDVTTRLLAEEETLMRLLPS